MLPSTFFLLSFFLLSFLLFFFLLLLLLLKLFFFDFFLLSRFFFLSFTGYKSFCSPSDLPSATTGARGVVDRSCELLLRRNPPVAERALRLGFCAGSRKHPEQQEKGLLKLLLQRRIFHRPFLPTL